MGQTINKKLLTYMVFFAIMALFFCTYLRVSLLFLYPVAAIVALYAFNWKISKNLLYLLGVVLVCWILSFRNGFHIKYNLVSFYYIIPFLFLLLSVPQHRSAADSWQRRPGDRSFLKLLMTAITPVVILNDIIGISQYINNPNDDSFVGIYGIFTVSQNGLSILNSILFFYYLAAFLSNRKRINLALCGFFITCAVMGFYGAGFVVLLASLSLTFLKFRRKSLLQFTFFTLVTLIASTMLMKTISPDTYQYNIAIIKKFLRPSAENAPRKITSFKNYFTGYGSHPADMLLGSGPGTYNSRSAFMVGSPTYFNLDIVKSPQQPYFFRNYAYPLWNASNTGPYDGFMNQPFSSILALLGEYGLIFTILLGLLFAHGFRRINRLNSREAWAAGLSTEIRTYKFVSIYMLLLIIIDNYLEYPEIIGLLVIILKLCEQELQKLFTLRKPALPPAPSGYDTSR